MAFAQRIAELREEGAYFVLAKAQALAKQGRDILHLEVGEPDFNTAPHIGMAAVRALAEHRTRYNPPAGVTDLRELIAADAGKRRGINVKPSQVVVSPGSKPSLFFATMALVDPGDEVIYSDPGFTTYKAMIQMAGGVPTPVPLLEEKGFSFDLDVFDRLVSERTKLIILNSPCNPTGGVIPLEDLRHIAEKAQQVGCWIISDEVYSRLVYDGMVAHSIASLPGIAERTVVVDGFSKTYAMTGWRLGYGIMPEELARRITLMIIHSNGCTAHFTQYAGIEALSGQQEWVDAMAAEYKRRRDRLVAGLKAIPGVNCLTPHGAFYVFPNIRAFGRSSCEIADYLLDEVGVSVLPGTCFGQHGEGYLRISYACSMQTIEEALARMEEALGKLGR
jgi:aspartate aminotransferase